MGNHAHFTDLIEKRLTELGARLHDIDEELGVPKPADLGEQAIDIEDDEVLESLGQAAEQEAILLRAALKRIEDGTYGICMQCGSSISSERLKAVLHAQLCRTCAGAQKA